MTSNEIVIRSDGKALTTSRLVAEVFGKEHSKVLRAIETLLSNQANFGSVMFDKSSYLDSKGEKRTMYIMNRDGFSLLVMGFTGKKALKFKLDFIAAFNTLEEHIRDEQSKLMQPKTTAEMLLASAQVMVDLENRLNSSEARTTALENKINAFERNRNEILEEFKMLPKPSEELPKLKDRDMIRKMVNDYSKATGISQQDIWHNVYAELYYRYGKNINSYKSNKEDKSKLDKAERLGLLDKIKTIVTNKCYSILKKTNLL